MHLDSLMEKATDPRVRPIDRRGWCVMSKSGKIRRVMRGVYKSNLAKNARRGSECSAEGVGEVGLVAKAACGGDFLDGEILVAE